MKATHVLCRAGEERKKKKSNDTELFYTEIKNCISSNTTIYDNYIKLPMTKSNTYSSKFFSGLEGCQYLRDSIVQKN